MENSLFNGTTLTPRAGFAKREAANGVKYIFQVRRPSAALRWLTGRMGQSGRSALP